MSIADSVIYLGGNFNSVNGGLIRNNIASINLTSGIAEVFSPNVNNEVRTIAVNHNVVFISGLFDKIGSINRYRLAAIGRLSRAPISWNPSLSSEGVIETMAILDSIIYIGGNFSSIGGKNRNGLAAVSIISGLSTNWNPAPTPYLTYFTDVNDIKIYDSTIYVGGNFRRLDGVIRNGIAAFNASSGQVTNWNPNLGRTELLSLTISESNVYTAGSFNYGVNRSNRNIKVFDKTTGINTGWSDGSFKVISSNYIKMEILTFNDRIFLGGNFFQLSGIPRTGFAVYSSCESSFIDKQLSCESYTWIDGLTYTSSTNTPTWTLINNKGCDSIITLNLTVKQGSFSDTSKTVCTNYKWPQNGVTYLTSGTYRDTLIGSNTCDSIITLNLTINRDSTFLSIEACKNYTWNKNNITYDSSGTYSHKLSNNMGCDSMLILNLIINQYLTLDTNIVSSCKEYTWGMNGVKYINSGIYSDTIYSSSGCDSIFTIDLEIIKPLRSISRKGDTLVSDATGSSYQWLDCNNAFLPLSGATSKKFLPIKGGSYTVEINKNGCNDTSNCIVSSVGIVERELNQPIRVNPNPNNGKVTIELDQIQSKFSIRLFNNFGQLIKSEIFYNSNNEKINIDGVPGIYLLEITDQNGERVVNKIIKD